MKLKAQRTIILLACMLWPINTIAESPQSGEIKKRIARQTGMSESEIQQGADAYGVNLDDPNQAMRRAKEMGISDQEIGRYIDGHPSMNTLPDGEPGGEEEILSQGESETDIDDQVEKEAKAAKTHDRDGGAIPHFGYDVFRSIPNAFKPSAIGPVDPGYVLGPGDVLRLMVWGEAEFQYELPVSKEGKVYIPKVGQVFVSGYPFEKLQAKVKRILSRHYSGLAKTPPTIFADLTVAKLRPIRVFIMGEVASPGGYVVSSYGTVFNALYSVGGPLKSGSLRNIRVYRNNRLITTVDIYDYLLRAKASKDIRLQNNDMVFVPPRTKTVLLKGEVLRQGYYELREKESLGDLLEFSGGLRSTSYINRAQILRLKPFDQRQEDEPNYTVKDIDLRKYIAGKKKMPLFDQDQISVFRVYQDLKDYVTITGAIKYPGIYEVEGLSLRKLVFELGQPIAGTTYLDRVDIVRVNDDIITSRILRVNLGPENADSGDGISLQAGDQVFVHSMGVQKPLILKVAVEGAVQSPGHYPLSSNMNVVDAILLAGGFTKHSFRQRVEVARMPAGGRSKDSLATVYHVELPENLDFWEAQKKDWFLLQDGDRVTVRWDPEKRGQETVVVVGHVHFTGKYVIEKRNERLSDILARAGGAMPEAFLQGAKLIRDKVPVVVDFESAVRKPRSDDNVIVQPGDSIVVPLKPNTVLVRGQTNNTGLFSFVEGERVHDYVDRAGGLTDNAQYIFLIKPNGESRKLRIGFFGGNPRVPEGSQVFVSVKPPKPEKTSDGPSIGEVIKDVFAIATSAVTLIVLVVELRKP